MTNTAPEPELWQHLIQWQPATAAALAAHIRSLPDDWPMRVFGVGRADAAFLLPPSATGEQFPDRAPEIAPYDEIAPLDDCPACTEAGGNCRFHEGFAAGYHEAVQAQLDAVKAQPGMGLREFMRWRADVEEAEDRGQEPPTMPVPAAVSAAVEPPADQTTPSHRAGLRDHIAGALIAWTYRGKDPDPETGILETVRANAYSRADAVLAVLYREWPWLRAEAEDAKPADRATVLRDAADAIDNSERLRDFTDDHMSDINEAANELRRMAAETATTETPTDPVQHAPGKVICCADCRTKGYAVCLDEPAETVHGCPPVGSGLTPCCGRTPFELPRADRISSEAPITCTGSAAGARQDGSRP